MEEGRFSFFIMKCELVIIRINVKEKNGSSFGLLTISALELEDSEQEIIPHEIVWSDDGTTSQTPATAHQHLGCETFTTVSSVTAFPVYVDVPEICFSALAPVSISQLSCRDGFQSNCFQLTGIINLVSQDKRRGSILVLAAFCCMFNLTLILPWASTLCTFSWF